MNDFCFRFVSWVDIPRFPVLCQSFSVDSFLMSLCLCLSSVLFVVYFSGVCLALLVWPFPSPYLPISDFFARSPLALSFCLCHLLSTHPLSAFVPLLLLPLSLILYVLRFLVPLSCVISHSSIPTVYLPLFESSLALSLSHSISCRDSSSLCLYPKVSVSNKRVHCLETMSASLLFPVACCFTMPTCSGRVSPAWQCHDIESI